MFCATMSRDVVIVTFVFDLASYNTLYTSHVRSVHTNVYHHTVIGSGVMNFR